jgi:diguanylate cyclase (GGDEF)-like protein
MADPREILNSIGEVVYTWDIASDQITWGGNVLDMLSLDDPSVVATGAAFADVLAPESTGSRRDAVMGATERDLGAGVRFQVQYGLMLGPASPESGKPLTWIEDTGRWFAGSDGRPLRAHGVIRIVAAPQQTEAKRAEHDRLDPATGLLNRAGLVDEAAQMLWDAQQNRSTFAAMLAGIDNLAVLNRSYGYNVADDVIVAVAQRLKSHLRIGDVIGRYAGNRFVLLLGNCDAEQMAFAAGRLIDAVVSAPVATSGGPVPVSMRIGGVAAPRDGRSIQTLLQHAEEAYDLCKAQASRRFVAFEPSLWRDTERIRSLAATDEIIQALNDRRIALALQPVVHAQTGALAFKEALVRLRRSDGRIIAPDLVMPIAERVGLVELIDRRVLEMVLDLLSADHSLQLSVNASASTVHDVDFIARITALLRRHSGVAERLTIEFTETAAIADLDATARTIAALKALGLRIAMDDFGAGFTSFRNLRRLSVDLLKIDGAFVQNLARSADDRFFVRTLIELARNLDIPTVAEWVEDQESADILAQWGVTYLQGHQFGKAELVEPGAAAPFGVAI